MGEGKIRCIIKRPDQQYGHVTNISTNLKNLQRIVEGPIQMLPIGGNAVILPGVTIGSNSVIGAGSVVTHDIPSWSIAAGNPCRVIRTITDADRNKLFKDEEIDTEVWDDIVANGFGGEG